MRYPTSLSEPIKAAAKVEPLLVLGVVVGRLWMFRQLGIVAVDKTRPLRSSQRLGLFPLGCQPVCWSSGSTQPDDCGRSSRKCPSAQRLMKHPRRGCVDAIDVRRSMLSPPCNEFVAHPLHSDDQFRSAGVLLEFLTKAVDVHIHSSRECSAVIAPD